jgi:hypothetical protein
LPDGGLFLKKLGKPGVGRIVYHRDKAALAPPSFKPVVVASIKLEDLSKSSGLVRGHYH